MAAPLLSMISSASGGGLAGLLMQQVLEKKNKEEADAAFANSEQLARNIHPGMPPGLEGNPLNTTDPAQAEQYAYNLMQHPETQAMGQNVLQMVLQSRAQQAQLQSAEGLARDKELADSQAARRAQDNVVFQQKSSLTKDVQPWVREMEPITALMKSMLVAKPGFAGMQTVLRSFARILNGGGQMTDKDVEAVIHGPGVSNTIQNIYDNLVLNKSASDDDFRQVLSAAASVYKQKRDTVIDSMGPLLRIANASGWNMNEFVNPEAFLADDKLDPAIAYTSPSVAQPAVEPARAMPGDTPITVDNLAEFARSVNRPAPLPGESVEAWTARVRTKAK